MTEFEKDKDHESDPLIHPELANQFNPSRNKVKPSAFKVNDLFLEIDAEEIANDRLKQIQRRYETSSTPSFSLGDWMQKVVGKISGRKLVLVKYTDFLFSQDAFDALDYFWGLWIDSPKKGDKVYTSTILISGWVLGKKLSVVSIRAIIDKTIIGES
ncbi:MAG: hypothetical protein HC769_32790, partial [Cyanobacteria bacterium CRU_2_1]|nr:hypothetical protein [Cyanobacteria bacterium CRU_2_1]